MSGEDAVPQAELKGLRAFAVRVGAYAGQRSPERPEWVELRGEQRAVAKIESQWREEDRLGWLVELDDGSRMLLYYVPNDDLWSGLLLR
jgi:hypothetical protein